MNTWSDFPPGTNAVLYCGCLAERIEGPDNAFAYVLLVGISPVCHVHDEADQDRESKRPTTERVTATFESMLADIAGDESPRPSDGPNKIRAISFENL